MLPFLHIARGGRRLGKIIGQRRWLVQKAGRGAQGLSIVTNCVAPRANCLASEIPPTPLCKRGRVRGIYHLHQPGSLRLYWPNNENRKTLERGPGVFCGAGHDASFRLDRATMSGVERPAKTGPLGMKFHRYYKDFESRRYSLTAPMGGVRIIVDQIGRQSWDYILRPLGQRSFPRIVTPHGGSCP